jgi:hypothetical protein
MEHCIVPMHIIEELPKKEVLGAGSHAIVYGDGPDQVIKKYYTESSAYKHEAAIQKKIQKILEDFPVRVPDIYCIHPKKPIIYMERIHPPSNFAPHQINLILGYDRIDDLDCLWQIPGIRLTRGFYAGHETIISLAKTQSWSQIKIANIAYIMGSITRHLLDNNIIPTGIKWSVDREGRIWLFNFRECREGYMDPVQYFYLGDCNSNLYDYYLPKTNQKGYLEYYNGYFDHTYEIDKNLDNMYFCVKTVLSERDAEEAFKAPENPETPTLEEIQYALEHI